MDLIIHFLLSLAITMLPLHCQSDRAHRSGKIICAIIFTIMLLIFISITSVNATPISDNISHIAGKCDNGFFTINDRDSLSIFTVNGISVFIDSGNLNDSKSLAFDKAAQQGFNRLCARIIASTNRDKIKNVPLTSILNAVDKHSIVSERMTSHSYKAVIDIQFNSAKVKAILDSLGVRYTDKYADQFVIIPILYRNGDYLFRQRDSVWYDAWNAIPTTFGLIDYVLPTDSLLSSSYITPQNIMIKSKNDILKLVNEIGRSVVIVFADMSKSDGAEHMDVNLRFISHNCEEIGFAKYTKTNRESDAAFIYRVISNITSRLDNKFKGVDTLRQAAIYVSQLHVGSNSIKNWPMIKRIMLDIPYIIAIYEDKNDDGSGSTADIAGNKEMVITLEYKIPPPILSSVLAANKLSITQYGNKLFVHLKQSQEVNDKKNNDNKIVITKNLNDSNKASKKDVGKNTNNDIDIKKITNKDEIINGAEMYAKKNT